MQELKILIKIKSQACRILINKDQIQTPWIKPNLQLLIY